MADHDWNIAGTYFETCNCDTACPCVFLSAPTRGECTVLIAWHIDDGHFNGIGLDGLNAALAVHAPGHMAEVEWRAAVYLDDKASDVQREALLKIFSGQAGGHPSVLASHVGTILGVSHVPIEYEARGRRRRLSVGTVAQAEIEAIEGQGGAEVTVTHHPLCVAPGYPAVAARSTRLQFDDHGLHWEMSDRNGFYSPFAYNAS